MSAARPKSYSRNSVRVAGRALAFAAVACAGLADGATIHGAGATFPAPLYAKWAEAYERATGTRVTYDAVGSAEGIARIRAGSVDFGATDVALPAEEARAAHLVEFPVVIGGVVPVVNLPGIQAATLRLDGAVLAGIYLGRVRRWNDEAIARLNPGVALPRANITIVHRGDGSGSTSIFTHYLSNVSSDWREQVGSGFTVAWPAGVGGEGNEGVASAVQRTRFAIGYVEYAYAKAHRLADVALAAADGTWTNAGVAAFGAAFADASDAMPESTTRIPAHGWPMSAMTWILIREDDSKAMPFFAWTLEHGDAEASGLDYVPLPAPMRDRLLRELRRSSP
jgi:phosphate transport system substrate-binding protein